MYFKKKFGKEGEDYATSYLEEQGYKILERNFACKTGEIDIIAEENGTIIFIEIKSRTNLEYGLPSEAVTEAKLKHIYRSAEYYLMKKHLYNIDTRIDVIEIYKYNNKYTLNHLKQVV